ncbi:hypothetical protein GH714_039521 [Hevea brasiliensis]|uniref:Formin-like protein n=1 Tax=Hevea brasiliensis TaxID=3981 RepID=A0A6A6KGI3_HEVBR|nr:hypothetical protein GH714_039521 [Hevea brasiliensis]
MQGSLWAETQKSDEASKAPEFDLSELQNLFSAVAPTTGQGGIGAKSNRGTLGPKSDKIELRRAYNCEIMLLKVKIPLSDLMSSILAMDDSALDVDQVDNLIKFCPTKEEMELLEGYNGDEENLGKCQQIKSSVKLKRIMQTILSLGNALNHGTVLDEKLPELLDFPKDLTNLEAATKIQLKYLAEEMQAVSKGLEKVVQELAVSKNDGQVSENFCKILKAFLSSAESEVRSSASLYATVGRNADALALSFGEDPARCPFEQVVFTMLNFVRMFVRAHDENCKHLEFEKKKAERETGNEKLKMVAPKKETENLMPTTIKNGNIK